jgi:hypothetical protein
MIYEYFKYGSKYLWQKIRRIFLIMDLLKFNTNKLYINELF